MEGYRRAFPFRSVLVEFFLLTFDPLNVPSDGPPRRIDGNDISHISSIRKRALNFQLSLLYANASVLHSLCIITLSLSLDRTMLRRRTQPTPLIHPVFCLCSPFQCTVNFSRTDGMESQSCIVRRMLSLFRDDPVASVSRVCSRRSTRRCTASSRPHSRLVRSLALSL